MRIDHPNSTDLPALRQLWQEAFSDTDDFLDIFFSVAYHPQRCFCVHTDGQIAAAAYWLDCRVGQRKAAYIYAVATAKSYRGRGYCRVLMTAIGKHLEKQGYCGSILVPGDDDLRAMYGKMGYADFGGIREFSCAPNGSPAGMTRINREEFAALWQKYLPENAVIQEKEALALLDALAEFYRGKDFLLTISRDGETIRVLELLGNDHAAANIAKAFGVTMCFRTPGSQPFAMYRPILDSGIPSYFAFAFD